MECKDAVYIEGMDNEDPAKRFLLSRMATALSKQISSNVEKLEVKKSDNKIMIRLMQDSVITESEAEDNNLFFAFGKAQEGLLKKIKPKQD